jgi:transposase
VPKHALKRLENGKFKWSRKDEEVLSITPQQYRWLMEELSIVQPKFTKKINGIKF